jgi:hypothetical protein
MLNRWKGQKLALGLTPVAPRVIPPDLPAEPESQTANASPPASAQPPVSTGVQKITALQTRQPQRSITPPPPPVQPRIQPAAQTPERSNSQGLPTIMSSSWTDPQGDVTLERGTRVINADEVQGLSKEQITLLYNEAYARHGRGFATPYIRNYFLAQSWYREDPDYHWRPDDQKVKSRQGKTDDPLVINANRTPKQWTNMQVLKRLMDSK